jgi:glycosyltransferase involved in cell wall biosynthesis
MNAPAVSVITASYKGAELVAETVESLLAQTFSDFELLIVDDCSPDDTLAVLRRFDDPRITIMPSDVNQGPVHARNRAFAAARGRYVAALDQDDICLPTRLEKQVAYLDAHPETVLVGTAAALLEGQVIRPGRLPPMTTPCLIDWLMRLSNPIVWSSTMFRADAARRLEPFTRPGMLYAEDFDLYHRLRPLGRIARIDEELTVYRSHVAGASQKYSSAMVASAARVLAEAYEPVFATNAPERAELVAAHVMARFPVPDARTLRRLAETVGHIHRHFFETSSVDAQSERLIQLEYSRLWWRVIRTGMRSGRIGLRDALAVRPLGALRGDSRPADLIFSRLIGRGRAIRRQTAFEKVRSRS